MARVLLLWDVDHTLIDNGGVSKENYALAFELLTGNKPTEKAETEGRTDLGIMDRLLHVHGVDPAKYPWPARAAALAEAGMRNREALSQRGRALPGAVRVLSVLAKHPEVIQSSLTGNILENAQVKLAAFNLDTWIDFDTGGFGSDEHRTRGELVPVAQRKAADKYGFDATHEVTVLVGDTPLDVEAGKSGGARVIGVATGESSASALRDAGADVVLADLEDLPAFLRALERVRELGPLARPRHAAVGRQG